MSKPSSSRASDDRDEYPKVTRADLSRAVFRVGLKPLPRKQRVTMLLDSAVVEHFRARAGGRGYQTLINEALRRSVEQSDIDERLRGVIREELQRAATRERT